MVLSTAETRAIRTRLLAKRGQLAKRRERVVLDASHRAEPLVADFADQAGQVQNDAVLAEIGAAASDDIAAIDLALKRLDAGVYGLCIECHAPINPRRLSAMPHAVTCAPCALAKLPAADDS